MIKRISIWFIVLWSGLNLHAAVVLKQQGLVTRTYGVQNAATPGDLGAVDFGSFTRRPYGPKLASWDKGWSAHNSTANARHVFTIPGASAEGTCGEYWAVYKFGEWGEAGAGNKLVTLTRVGNAGGAHGFHLAVDTMQLTIDSTSGAFTAQPNVRVIPRGKWCAFGIGWQNTGGTNWTLRFNYIEAGGVEVSLFTATNVNLGFTSMPLAYGGTLWDNAALISARFGLPSLYSMATINEMGFPSDLTLPVDVTWDKAAFGEATFPQVWYISSAATGGGDGTSIQQAWTPAEFVVEMGNSIASAVNYTITSGRVIDNTNTEIDISQIDADVLAHRMKKGIYRLTGDRVYFDDTAGPLRFIDQIVFRTCPGIVVESAPFLGRKAELRQTTQEISGWTLHSGSVYRKAWPTINPVVFEFDNAAKANERYAKPRWIAHPTAADITAYMAAATPGSFHCSGGFLYYWPSDSGNPNTNAIYPEVTHHGAFTDFFVIITRNTAFRNIALRLCAAVDNTNSGGGNSTGRNYAVIDAEGMSYAEGLLLEHGGKHNDCWVPARFNASASSVTTTYPSRFIMINCTQNDHRPYKVGVGDNTLTVEDAHDSPIVDSQFYREGVVCVTNSGTIGSTVGQVDVSQPTSIQHNDTNGNFYPISKGWWVNSQLPGQFAPGSITATMNVIGCTLGTGGSDIIFGAKNHTITNNKLFARNMLIGIGVSPQAGTHTIRSNQIISTGAVSTPGTVIGTISFIGNTWDLRGLTGGSTLASWTRGGVTSMTMGANNILMPASDSIALIDAITPASGDALVWRYNYIQMPNASLNLVRNYAGAAKTLAQLKSGGQDIGSVTTTSALLNPDLTPMLASPVRDFVPVSAVTGLGGTGDYNNKVRSIHGLTESGAILYTE